MVVEALVQGRAAGNEMLSSESQATKQLLTDEDTRAARVVVM